MKNNPEGFLEDCGIEELSDAAFKNAEDFLINFILLIKKDLLLVKK